jgi:hypothetical protein
MSSITRPAARTAGGRDLTDSLGWGTIRADRGVAAYAPQNSRLTPRVVDDRSPSSTVDPTPDPTANVPCSCATGRWRPAASRHTWRDRPRPVRCHRPSPASAVLSGATAMSQLRGPGRLSPPPERARRARCRRARTPCPDASDASPPARPRRRLPEPWEGGTVTCPWIVPRRPHGNANDERRRPSSPAESRTAPGARRPAGSHRGVMATGPRSASAPTRGCVGGMATMAGRSPGTRSWTRRSRWPAGS